MRKMNGGCGEPDDSLDSTFRLSFCAVGVRLSRAIFLADVGCCWGQKAKHTGDTNTHTSLCFLVCRCRLQKQADHHVRSYQSFRPSHHQGGTIVPGSIGQGPQQDGYVGQASIIENRRSTVSRSHCFTRL